MQRAIVMAMMCVVLVGCGEAERLVNAVSPSPTPISRYSKAYSFCLDNIPMSVLYARPVFGDNGKRGYEITIRLDDSDDSAVRVAACILHEMEVPQYVIEKISNTRQKGVTHNEKVNDLDVTWIIESVWNRLTITVIDLNE